MAKTPMNFNIVQWFERRKITMSSMNLTNVIVKETKMKIACVVRIFGDVLIKSTSNKYIML